MPLNQPNTLHRNLSTRPPKFTQHQLRLLLLHIHTDTSSSRQSHTTSRRQSHTTSRRQSHTISHRLFLMLHSCHLPIMLRFTLTNRTTSHKPSSLTAHWHTTHHQPPSFTIKSCSNYNESFPNLHILKAPSSSVISWAFPITILTFLTHFSRINCELSAR